MEWDRNEWGGVEIRRQRVPGSLHKGNLYHIRFTSTKSLFSHSSAQGTVFWSAKCSHPKVFDMEHQKRAWNVVESCNLEKDGKRVGFILVFGLPSATFTCRSRRAQAAFRHRLYRASLRLCEAGQRKHDSQLLWFLSEKGVILALKILKFPKNCIFVAIAKFSEAEITDDGTVSSVQWPSIRFQVESAPYS